MNDTRDHVVLVNPANDALGTMEKLAAHQTGVLHRAFSVFIFNEQQELLLQQRASHKYHGANLWTNTCCSHQQWNESTLAAAKARLQYEMGLSCTLEEYFSFIYHAEVENNLIEHELDFICVGYTQENPNINPDEVKDYKWIAIPDLLTWMNNKPEEFTYWFKEVLPTVLAKLGIN